MFKNFKQPFLKIWRDPVWSKVISAGIIVAIATLWAKLTSHSWGDIYQFVITGLSFKIPVFLFLSAYAVYFIVEKCLHLFKQRKEPIWDEQIGHYIFKDLYNILLTEKFPVATYGMNMSGRRAPEENLLVLFQTYQIFLNQGVGINSRIDDGGYLYAVFAPHMVSYGLVEIYQKPDEDLPNMTDTAYQTSQLGHKFLACLNKIILAEKMKKIKQKKGNYE